MSGCPTRHQWLHFLEDRLPAAEQREMEAHAQDCRACQQMLEELTQPAGDSAATLHASPNGTSLSRAAPSLDESYCHYLAHLLCDPASPEVVRDQSPGIPAPLPEVPGYELLEELGRGGMGVVFKARQTGLNRLVALKMVLGGHQGDPQRLERFRREAEAVAQLQHPHIVQIHEIGALEGQPFFAMEYVSGGSLDRQLRGQPQPPRDAAELVRTLAEAMQAAHDRGIIHRDLKPANILLAGGRSQESGISKDEGADSSLTPDSWLLTPKITDFGLAKRLEDEGGQTRTGEIVGTPSYMAPEQAAGKTKTIGPGTDIYALGAILYEMLTGRPPFKGLTPMETVLEVLHDEPLPPRRLMPKLPRDLDTICLKCLQKEPARRYLTAQALAEDVQRFLDNRPILARPAGRTERTWRWCRRNPVLASLAGLLALAVVGLAVGFVLLWRSYDQLAEAQQQTTKALVAEAKRRQQAREALDAMTGKVMDDLLASQQHLKASDKAFLQEVLARYRELVTDTGNDPASRAEVARAYLRVGDILRRLGDHTAAEAAYRQAIRHFDDALRDAPRETECRQALAGAYHNLGVLLIDRSVWPAAREALEQSYILRRQLVAAFPDRMDFATDLAFCHNTLSTLMGHQSDRTAALGHSEAALHLLRRACQATPTNLEWRYRLSMSLQNQARLRLEQADLAAARALYEESDAITGRLIQESPDYTYGQHRLHALETHAMCLMNLSEIKTAKIKLDEANRLAAQLVRDFPAVPELRQVWGGILVHLGNIGFQQKDLPQATDRWQQAQGLFARLVEDYPALPAYRDRLGSTILHLGIALMYRQQYGPARKEFEQAIATYKQLVAEDPQNREYWLHLSLCYSNLGNLSNRLKEYPAAKVAFAETERLQQQALAADPKDIRLMISLGGTYCNLGNVTRDEGDLATALQWYGKAVDPLDHVMHLAPELEEARTFLFNACMGRAGVLNKLRRYPEALADWQRLPKLSSRPLAPLLRLPRALAMAHAGSLEEAVAEAKQLSRFANIPADSHFELARLWAVAARKAGTAPRAEPCAAAAMQHLRQAHKVGYFRTEASRKLLQTEEDFSELRQHHDFRKLLEEVTPASAGKP